MTINITRKTSLILFAILAAGLLLRAGYVLSLRDKVYWVDEADYLALAQSCLDGEGFVNEEGQPTAFRPPGYPMLLMALKAVGIHSLITLRLFQAFLGTVTIYLVYLLAAMVLNRNAGILAALITAFYPYYIFISGPLLATTWFTFLLTGATLLLHRGVEGRDLKPVLASALAFGLAILTRPSALVLVAAAMFWIIAVVHYNNLKRACGILIPFILVVAVALAPWLYRNVTTMGTWQLVTNGGRNLWLGNNRGTSVNSNERTHIPAELEERLAAARTEAAWDAVYRAEARKIIAENPRRFLSQSLKKGLAMWRWDPSPSTDGYVDRNSAVRWASIFSVGPVFILGIAGFLLLPVNIRKKASLWLFYAIVFTLLHGLFISKVRFRLPLDVFTIMLASYAIALAGTKLSPLTRGETVE